MSQKIQKSEFWNATYPSGFHRLDEPPEKNSALWTHKRQICIFGCTFGRAQYGQGGVPEKILQNAVQMRWS